MRLLYLNLVLLCTINLLTTQLIAMEGREVPEVCESNVVEKGYAGIVTINVRIYEGTNPQTYKTVSVTVPYTVMYEGGKKHVTLSTLTKALESKGYRVNYWQQYRQQGGFRRLSPDVLSIVITIDHIENGDFSSVVNNF